MNEIPDIVRQYVNDNIPYPVGLIGCRSIKPEISLDCCEYDLAIFNNYTSTSRTLKIGKYNVELINLPALPNLKDPLILKDMILLHDDRNFTLASAINGSKPKDYLNTLIAFGRRAIINCLFHCEKINSIIKTQPLLSSLWIKISAYDFLEGILALSGLKPMPIHELYQIRRLTILRQDIADAVLAALECIGVKRATRYVILRSFEGISQLNSNVNDKKIAFSKIEHLLNMGMMSDCYYYIGKLGRSSLVNRNEKFYMKYIKLIQISMDLDSDMQRMEKMYTHIVKASKSALKS
ncbi:MAG: hypothetical protein ACJ709_01975 [Nitrososphaeraceae archaeon]